MRTDYLDSCLLSVLDILLERVIGSILDEYANYIENLDYKSYS